MPQCAAFGCTNKTGNPDGKQPENLTFHRFPTTSPDILKQWVDNIGRENFTPNRNSRLCSRHFLPHSFREDKFAKYNISSTTTPRPLLEPDAIPTEFLRPMLLQQQQQHQPVTEGLSSRSARMIRQIAVKRPTGTRRCYAAGCTNSDNGLIKWRQKRCATHGVKHWEASCDCPPPYKLYSFPKKKRDPEKRERWIQAFWRADPDNPRKLLKPSRDHRVCSVHFVDGKPTCNHPDPELHLICTGKRKRKLLVPSLHRPEVKSVKLSPKTGDDVQEPTETPLPVQVFVNNHFHQATESATILVISS